MIPYYECVPTFSHIVNRKCTKEWEVRGMQMKNNIILVYDGESFLKSDDNTYKASKGDLIYCKPGVYREGYTFPKNLMKCYSIDFDVHFYDKENNNIVKTDLPLKFSEKVNDEYIYEELIKIFNKMVYIWKQNDEYKQYDLNIAFMKLMKVLNKWKEGDNKDFEKERKVKKTIKYLSENIGGKIVIEEIACSLGVSTSYISRIFKEVTNKTIIEYYCEFKMEKAKQYLEDGYKVGDCAEKLGYSDIYYFSKQFKQYEGVSPKKYKYTII